MWRSLLLLTMALLVVSSSSSSSAVMAESQADSQVSQQRRQRRRRVASSCSLPCQNGGVCKVQQQQSSIIPWLTSLSSPQSNQTVQACDCSNTNYLGEYCDVRIQPCQLTSTVVCLYGSTCVEDGTGFHCICDPSVTNSDGSSACQQHKTQVCAIPGQPPGRSGNSYCVNDGVCDNQGGCTCPYGYGGPHCEYLGDAGLMSSSSSAAFENNTSGGGRGNVAFVAAMVVVAVVFVIIGGVLGGRYYRRRQTAARERQVVEQTLLNTSGPFDRNNNKNNVNGNGDDNNVLIDLGHPQRDFDGNELEEVEII